MISDVRQGSLNAIVSPSRILLGESDNRIDDFPTNPWPADGLSFVAVVPIPGHKFAVPAKDRVWRDDGCQFQQCLATNGVGLHGEQPALVVIEEQSLLTELLEQSLDLCVLELNDLLLPLVDHAAEGGEQDVPGLEQEGHVRRRNWPVSGAGM